jgi:hypothetical protein
MTPYNKKYTLELCKAEALKYTTKYGFRTKAYGYYKAAVRNRWLTEVCMHLEDIKHPVGYWNKENCAEEAKKYKHRADFKHGNSSAYSSARVNSWLDEVCQHMVPKDFNYLYCGYVILNKRLKLAYVGITKRFAGRKYEHFSDKNICTSKKLTSESGSEMIQLTDYVIPSADVKDFEELLYAMYVNTTYTVVNDPTCLGLLGSGKRTWTKEKCTTAVNSVTTLKELTEKHPNVAMAIWRNGWQSIAPHLTFGKPNNYWTKERCLDVAKNYTSLKDFKNHEDTAYGTIRRHGWLEDLKRLVTYRKPNGYWEVKERCIEEASKYSSKSEFAKKSVGAYNSCRKFNWLEEACSHMPQRKPQ